MTQVSEDLELLLKNINSSEVAVETTVSATPTRVRDSTNATLVTKQESFLSRSPQADGGYLLGLTSQSLFWSLDNTGI
jgi:hypothetical protein